MAQVAPGYDPPLLPSDVYGVMRLPVTAAKQYYRL